MIEQSSKDKSNLYGFTLPKGTWFGIYKVDNDGKIAIIKLPLNHGFVLNQVISITGSDSEVVNKEHRVFYTDSDSIRIKTPLLNSTTIGGIKN